MDAGVRPREQTRHPRRRARVRWTELHERLSEHPVFAACSRAQIRQLARWGDDVEVGAGQVLLREDMIGHWFVAVISGQVRLTRGGDGIATLGPGAHVGDVAILGFGPQRTTAVAVVACRVFVLGQRALISAAALMPGVRNGLAPGLDERQFTAHVRRLRADGAEAWRRLPAGARKRASETPKRPAWLGPARGRGRTAPDLSWIPSVGREHPRLPRPAVPAVRLRTVLVPATAMLCAVLVTFAVLWHPPALVVTPGEPIDVTADLGVSGVRTYPVHGRFVLTPVTIRRPTLGGYLLALARHRHTVPVDPGGRDEESLRRAGRQAFADGRRHAVAAVAAALGIDPSRLHVTFRQRDVQGPSAALVYALALADLLGSDDVARGRVVAATGELGDDGTVGTIGFVSEKAAVARATHAELFLVPRGQDPGGRDVPVAEVTSLRDALAILATGTQS
jgi:hypothetical protein